MNLKNTISLALSLLGAVSFGQVGINTEIPHASSILESKSENRGFLFPKLTQDQITGINNAAEGLTVFNTTTNMFETYNGSIWSQTPFYPQDFWKILGNQQTVSNSTNIIGNADARIFNIRTNNIKALNIETNGQVLIGDRILNKPRLYVTRPAVNTTLPTIALQHSTGFGDGVRYPNTMTLTNVSTGKIIGNIAFADNTNNAANGISVAGISYIETGSTDSGFSFYTGGHPTSSSDTNFERMKVISNGNVGIGTGNPLSKLQIEDGDIFITDSTKGIVLNSGSACYRITVNNSGTLSTNSITCP